MTRPRVKSAASVVAAALSTVLLVGCGGQSAYCSSIEEKADTLNSFGKTRTDAAYASYAKTFRSIAKQSPATVKKDWTELADVTEGVLAAQKKVGLPLEDMKDRDTVAKLDEAQLKTLNDAYEAFNATSDQRTAVVKNAKTECEITLK